MTRRRLYGVFVALCGIALAASVWAQYAAWRTDVAKARQGAEDSAHIAHALLSWVDASAEGGLSACGLCLAPLRSGLETMELGSHLSLSVVDASGVLVARRPEVAGQVGRHFSEGIVAESIETGQASRVVWESPVDGEVRVYHSVRHPTLPYYVVVGHEYAPLRRAMMERAAVHGLFLLLTWGLGFALLQAVRRAQRLRREVEATNRSLVAEIETRRTWQEEAEQRMTEQRFAASFASRLLDVEESNAHRILVEQLASIGEELLVDRAWMLLVNETQDQVVDVVEWLRPGISDNTSALDGFDLSVFASVAAGAREGGFAVADIEAERERLTEPERAQLRAWGVRGISLLPLRVRDELIGVFGVDRAHAPLELSPERRMTLQTVRDILAATLGRLRRERALAISQRRFFAILNGEGTAAIQGYGRDLKVLFWNRASEALYGASAEEMVGTTPLELMSEAHRADYLALVERMFETGVAAPPEELSVVSRDGTPRDILSHHVLVDIEGAGRELYVINLDLTERKQLEERLRLQATTDELTRIANRRYFMDRARREVARVQRHGGSMSLITLDVDHFKSVNDGWGHAAGDAVLVELARRLAAAVRETDLVARIGGEEFALLLPNTDLGAAQVLAERLRREIAETPFAVGEETTSVTISAGVSTRCDDDDQIEAMLRSADEALYRAKEQGRNRVVVAESELDGTEPTGA